MKSILMIHRWLGVVACIAVLLFASSGILHPVMSWLQPKPAQSAPPRVDMSLVQLPLRAVLEKNRIDRFSTAALVQLSQQSAYRVQTESGTQYFRADRGEPVIDGEKIHAEFLARHFIDDNDSPILSIAEQRKFDNDYVFVNQLLPVWRIDFARDDGMRVYVDTAGNRLATLSDTKKRIFQIYFRALHDFDFLEEHGALRLAIMILLLFAAFATAVGGVVMYVRIGRASQRLKNLPARRWHRRLSLAVAAATFSFTVSGAWHLLHSQRGEKIRAQRVIEMPAASPAQFLTGELGDALAPGAFALLRVNDRTCFRLNGMPARDAQHAHHHASASKNAAPSPCLDTHTLQPIADADARVAETLARHYAQNRNAVAAMEFITAFGGEYGFVNKRLPVWKIQFENDSARWYVETASGALALRTDDSDAREGWFFSIFHKARFIGDGYKTARDIFLMVCAAAMIVVSLLGLWLFMRRTLRV